MPMTRPIDRLLAIMARLRDPDHGCPWDVQQNFATIAPYTIEEAYEVADAIERADMAALKDELGDLLLQVVFHARMAEEAGHFAFDDVATAIADKMVRRHPHVFGDAEIASVAAQNEAWEAHKAAEREAKGDAGSVLDGVALALPALLRAAKISQRAARIGFDWPDARAVIAKIAEEIVELEAELDAGAAPAAIEEEMGDLLFAAANLARKLEIEPETALRRGTAKFEHRFRRVEALARERGIGRDIDALEALWQEVKASELKSPELRLAPVTGDLPAGFELMRAEAGAEGYRMLDTLAAGWETGVTRFDRDGEALFAVYAGGALAGIGGLTHEAAIPGALRMRRFYIRAPFRRGGVGRKLARTLLEPALAAGRVVTVNAGGGSDPFWEALGFVADRRDGHTHILRPAPAETQRSER
ncbi:MAG TPA: nucleoside triphosphate pyrophosphohydrolase [Stellaceae bacterium]|nr:nucleoside triphosphate pyrophosphohydrolase [Stellaceae bacterium]